MEDKILNNKKPIIVTHNGSFHTDDCFAVATLLLYLKKDSDEVEIVRSRDPRDLSRGDFVVDVGGIYDERKNRFDHHQIGGAGKRENGISYAAFGLVWKKFGEKICGSLPVAKKVDVTLVMPTDAHDNGIALVEPILKDVYPYFLDQFVHMSNPTWQEDGKSEDQKFLETMHIFKRILERTVIFLNGENIAEALIVKEYQNSRDKRIIILEKDYPWRTILQKFPEPLFVVYPRDNGTYGVKAVQDSQFNNRRDFPSEWAGKRDAELAEITGVEDAIFAHNGRFMAVARSRDGAMALAKLALEDKN